MVRLVYIIIKYCKFLKCNILKKDYRKINKYVYVLDLNKIVICLCI